MLSCVASGVFMSSGAPFSRTGYGNWFNQLFQLVKCGDPCQPEQAVEPSAHLSESEPVLEDCPRNQAATANQFIPIETKIAKKE